MPSLTILPLIAPTPSTITPPQKKQSKCPTPSRLSVALIALSTFGLCSEVLWKMRNMPTFVQMKNSCRTYQGYLLNGRFEGEGTLTLTNATQSCVNSFKTVFLKKGTSEIYSEGDFLKGIFRNNNFIEGEVQLTTAEKTFVGHLKNGVQQHGKHIQDKTPSEPEGTICIGEWSDEKFSGTCTRTSITGQSATRKFLYGNAVSAILENPAPVCSLNNTK